MPRMAVRSVRSERPSRGRPVAPSAARTRHASRHRFEPGHDRRGAYERLSRVLEISLLKTGEVGRLRYDRQRVRSRHRWEVLTRTRRRIRDARVAASVVAGGCWSSTVTRTPDGRSQWATCSPGATATCGFRSDRVSPRRPTSPPSTAKGLGDDVIGSRAAASKGRCAKRGDDLISSPDGSMQPEIARPLSVVEARRRSARGLVELFAAA